MTGLRHLTLLPSVFMQWAVVHYPGVPSHATYTCCSAQLRMKPAAAKKHWLSITAADFSGAQCWDHRLLPRRTLCFIVLLLRDPTPMQVSKRHSRDSQGSCGVNYLSQPPTLPDLDLIFVWVPPTESEHLRGVRLLQVWSRWRTLNGEVQRHHLHQRSPDSQESTQSCNDLVHFVWAVSHCTLMSDVRATTFIFSL